MKKYKPANLKSVREFIQRMLDGERFYGEGNQYTYYFSNETFRAVGPTGQKVPFDPVRIVGIDTLLTEEPYTIQDALAEKPRFCWVWNGGERNPKNMITLVTKYEYCNPDAPFFGADSVFMHAELATLEEIKQYLED